MEETLFSEKFRIISALVNPMGRLGLYGTLNLLQDTSWLHASYVNAAHNILRKDLLWVFTRQNLKMSEWPRGGEFVTIQTWLRPPSGAFITRNFTILNQDGREIGQCAASFLALEKATRKIVPASDLRPWEKIVYDREINVSPEKIPVEGTYEKLTQFKVRNSDLDGYEHVNNTKYAQWILDAIPYSSHQQKQLHGYAVNFLAETKLADEVELFQAPAVFNPDLTSGKTAYKGLRASDQKVLFTAEIEWSKRA